MKQNKNKWCKKTKNTFFVENICLNLHVEQTTRKIK